MTAVRAIETVYQGYRFRSRLEARWAVFFDALGVEWDYEPQGFDLDGVRYLPDFWLKTVEMWAEVKGLPLNSDEERKCRLLANATWRPVLKLVGVPTFKPYFAVEPEQMDWPSETDYLLDDQYLFSEHRFFGSPACQNDADASVDYEQSDRTRAAYAAARGARFEHGEHGAPAVAGNMRSGGPTRGVALAAQDRALERIRAATQGPAPPAPPAASPPRRPPRPEASEAWHKVVPEVSEEEWRRGEADGFGEGWFREMLAAHPPPETAPAPAAASPPPSAPPSTTTSLSWVTPEEFKRFKLQRAPLALPGPKARGR